MEVTYSGIRSIFSPYNKDFNKILNYQFNESNFENTITKDFLDIGNKVILFFIIILIYLFSALEEADWNVFSANQKYNERFHDDTMWNINQLTKNISQKLIS